jgi:SAM-dependent methyltransferase
MNDVGTRSDSTRRGRPTPRQLLDIVKRFVNPGDRSNARHDFCNVFRTCRSDISKYLPVDIMQAKVLVLGCGYHYPDVALWSKVAAQAVGVDIREVFWRNGQHMLYDSLRRSGQSKLRSLAESVYKRRGYASYFRKLSRMSEFDLDFRHQDLVAYDGARLPFADASFDVVCSNAVLEHVSDLAKVSRELNRVTKKGGINYHLWHNYYALSGGHVRNHLAISRPWGHLLGDKEVERYLELSGTSLNKLQPGEITKVLSESFAPLAVMQVDAEHRKKGSGTGFKYEGEDLLTREIENRLQGCSREVLLTRAYLFIGQR